MSVRSSWKSRLSRAVSARFRCGFANTRWGGREISMDVSGDGFGEAG
jgi:hypothetical protein